jgi:hypothetical protein
MWVGSSVGVGGGIRYLVSLLAAVVAAAWMPVSAQAAFGLEDFDVAFSAADGSPAAQAGSHPFAMRVSVTVSSGDGETEGRLRELLIELPQGLVVNPFSVPRCPMSVFLDPEDDCPLSTTVGISSSAYLELGVSADSHIYRLLAPEGVLLRLGFEVAGANVVADVGLNPGPPHNLIAVVGSWPEAFDVFATDLELWGVPTATIHDAARGGAVDVAPSPFLTLPTSCEGPQETFYEAVSWEGDAASGSVFTHDNATPPNPMGFAGCGRLAFRPSFVAQLTTDEAKSHAGLDLSLEFFDEGLSDPSGIAESQLRDLVLALPDGLALDSAVVGGLERCSDAEFEAAGLEDEAGGGCPEGSKVGAIAIESPLLAEPIAGEIFAAEPLDGEGIEALDLFVVVEDLELGLVLKQIVELEPDPETGELLAFAEDFPMLPFSDLHILLPEGPESLLVTPPLCGSYDGHDVEHEPIRALLNPWSGGPATLTAASFETVAGPNGGPCPDPAAAQSAPAAHAVALPDTTAPDTMIFKRVLGRRPPVFLFRFQATESNSTFRCKLDGGPFRPCRREMRLRNLTPGRHVLRVFAIDPSGTGDPSPAVVRFRYPNTARRYVPKHK